MLDRRCDSKLDCESKEAFSRIASAARNMSNLIDALMSLSKADRCEIKKVTVNLCDIALEIIALL
jgi:hypothetical protein